MVRLGFWAPRVSKAIQDARQKSLQQHIFAPRKGVENRHGALRNFGDSKYGG